MIECMEDMTATEVVRERMTFIISKESEINVIKSDDDLWSTETLEQESIVWDNTMERKI